MNALTPYEPQQSGGSFAMVPQNLSEAMELAKMMAANNLLHETFRGKPAHCLMVIEQAGRWRMSPFAVALSVSVIQNKLMYEGKTIAAAVNTQPCMAGRLSYDYSGEGETRSITVSGTVKGEANARTVEVKLRDARTTNKIWNTQPDQQLAYSGARVWARRHTPEVLMGVYAPEEFDGVTIEHRTDPEPRRAEPKRAAPVAPLTMGETIGDSLPDFDAPAPEPPKPDPIHAIRNRLTQCETAEQVARVQVAWSKTVRSAAEAGRAMPQGVLDMVNEMISARNGELTSGDAAEPAMVDDMGDAL